MRDVRAALRHDVDVAAERASELCLPARGHHLELIDGVHAVRHAAQPGGIVVGGQTVHDEVVGEVALAADGDALAGHRRRLGEELSAADVGRRDPWHEKREVEKIAPVQRQVLDLRLA